MSSLLRLLLLSLTLASCTSPAEKRGLVNVRRSIPGIKVDLRYTTPQNITRKPLYPVKMPCLLRTSTAEKLKKAQALLHAQGYGLKIWDAWRPLEAHRRLYEYGAKTGMYLDPQRGWSRHCGGVSVDVTLVNRQGVEMRMPTYFDEDLHHAASSQTPSDPEIRQNLAILQGAMKAAGFAPLPGEWWHFDDLDFLYRSIPAIRAKDIGLKLP